VTAWLAVERDAADSPIRSVHVIPEHDEFGHRWCNCDCGVSMTTQPQPNGMVAFMYTHEAWCERGT
jgi:hypothetical protein